MWNLTSQDMAPMVVLVAMCIAWAATKGFQAWRQREQARLDADVKLEMISRGMSADDIVRVLQVKSSKDGLAETQVHGK